MKQKNDSVLEFEFQTVKLDEVANLIPTYYRSKYEAIRQQVIAKIRSMAGDETFIFAPSKNSKGPQLDEKLIVNICDGINTALVKEMMNWKIAYSQKAKAFVVAPHKRYKLRPRNSVSQAVPQPTNGYVKKSLNTAEDIKRLVSLVNKHLRVSVEDLRKKQNTRAITDVKRAFLYVGNKILGIPASAMGDFFNLSSGTTHPHINSAMNHEGAQKAIEVLTNALNQKGA